MKKLCLTVFFGYCLTVVALNVANAKTLDLGSALENKSIEEILQVVQTQNDFELDSILTKNDLQYETEEDRKKRQKKRVKDLKKKLKKQKQDKKNKAYISELQKLITSKWGYEPIVTLRNNKLHTITITPDSNPDKPKLKRAHKKVCSFIKNKTKSHKVLDFYIIFEYRHDVIHSKNCFGLGNAKILY